MSTVLITGGAGYIGSHTAAELLENCYSVVAVDNLCNSSRESLRRVCGITGKKLDFYEGDVRDAKFLREVFSAHKIDAVFHFAGLKSVPESCKKPLEYYDNNVRGTITLSEEMKRAGVGTIVFSSSATVYGHPEKLPVTEDCALSAINPYGAAKIMAERILRDMSAADKSANVIILRYFNPVGAHPSGLIGEDPAGAPGNLMPLVAQAAYGRLGKVKVFGGDYPTRDGTCVRDYIHVSDLAKGHIAALKGYNQPGVHICNLGTGRGYTVLEVIEAYSRACGRPVPYEIVGRRQGDSAACYASADKAFKDLGWKAELGLAEMCSSSWKWQKSNPDGYGGKPR